MLIGLGSGCLTMTFAALVTSRWFVRRRGLVTGVLSASSHLGQLLFLPLLAWAVDRYDWQPPVVTLALAALTVSALVALFLRDHPADVGALPYGSEEFVAKPAPAEGAARRTLTVLVQAMRTGTFWLLAGMFVICGASTNGIMWSNWVPAAHDHGMHATVAASMLSLIGVFSSLGAAVSGWLTDRFDPRRLLAVYFTVRALTLLTLPLLFTATARPSMIAFAVVYGLVDVATVPPVIALCQRTYGDDGPIVFGWTNSAHQLGAGASAFLGATARDVFGTYDTVWVTLSAVCLVAALLAVVVRVSPGGAGRPEAGSASGGPPLFLPVRQSGHELPQPSGEAGAEVRTGAGRAAPVRRYPASSPVSYRSPPKSTPCTAPSAAGRRPGSRRFRVASRFAHPALPAPKLSAVQVPVGDTGGNLRPIPRLFPRGIRASCFLRAACARVSLPTGGQRPTSTSRPNPLGMHQSGTAFRQDALAHARPAAGKEMVPCSPLTPHARPIRPCPPRRASPTAISSPG